MPGSLQCSPDPLAIFKGPTSEGREGKGGGKRRRGSGGREGMVAPLPQLVSLDPPVTIRSRHTA